MSLFFELLQLSLGTRDGLSRVPSVREWEEVYEEAEKQGILGVLLDGLQRCMVHDSRFTVNLPLDVKLQWIGETQIIEQQNRDMDRKCVELLGMLKKAGLRGSILKGQGIARLYDEELGCRRQPGDIDVYVDCGLEKALAFARSLGQKDISWDYKHLHLNLWEDTEVEMHYRVEVLLNLRKNRRLQMWFEAHKEQIFNDNENHNDNEGVNTNLQLDGVNRTNRTNEFTTPTVEFNLFYILLHIYRHFLHTGIGMRQVMDYFFVLKEAYRLRLTAYSLIETVRTFGMERFTRGLMWMMKETMAMPREWMPWEPDEKEGRYILAQVMEGGNFGHYSERRSRLTGGLGYVMRIVRHSLHLMSHYPSEALWAPVWVVWHKGWKIKKRWQLRALL